MALTRLRRRMYDSQKNPLAPGLLINIVNQKNNNPVRIYTADGLLLNDNGESFLAASGYVDVYVLDNTTYKITAFDSGGRVIARTFDIQPEDLYDDQSLSSSPPSSAVSTVFISADSVLIDQNGNAVVAPEYVPVPTSRNVLASDDDRFLVCAADVTLTVPDGLAMKRGFVAIPAVGSSVIVTAPATVSLNDVLGATLTFTRANNAAGVGISYLGAANFWGVSGSLGDPVLPDATSSVKGAVQLAGDFGGSAASPSVVKIRGVDTPSTAPSAGQFLRATSGTAAAWTDALATSTASGVVSLTDLQDLGANRKTIDTIVIGRGNPAIAARTGNTIIGFQANNSSAIGDNITAVGRSALGSSTVDISGSTAFGNAAGRVNTKINGTFIGAWSGESNTGQNVTTVGQGSGQRNTALNGTFVGVAAGSDNTGTAAVGIGVAALQTNTGTNCVGFGEGAGYFNTGSNGTFLGYQSKRFGADGLRQTFVGTQSGYANTATDYVAVGSFSGRWQDSTSNFSVIVGGFSANMMEGQYNSTLGHNAGSTRPTALATNVTLTQVSPGVFTISPALASLPTTRLYSTVTAVTATPIVSFGLGSEAPFTFTSTTDCTSLSTRFSATDNGKTATISLYVPYTYSNVTLLGANTIPSSANQVVLGDTSVTSLKIGNNLFMDVSSLLGATGGESVSIRVVSGKKTIVSDSNAYVSKSADYTILNTDVNLKFSCSGALVATVTATSGDTIWFPPATGNLTIRASGVTLNGGSADQLRTLALNRSGIAIAANPVVANDFTVTGF